MDAIPKKKILFIVPSMVGGGVERCLLNLIYAMDPKKYNISIVAIKSGGDLVSDIPNWVNYRYIWKNEWRILGRRIPGSDRLFSLIFSILSPQMLCKIFVRERYDVAIDYWGQEGLKIILGMESQVKKLVFIHSDMNTESLKQAWFPFSNHHALKQAYSTVDYIINVSQDCRQSMLDRFEFPADSNQLIVRYNINLNENIIQKSTEPIPEEYTADDFCGLTMCAVGRLTKVKGFDRLIKICHKLKTDQIDFRLWVLGQGEEQANLEALISQYGLERQVKLLGFQRNPYAFMAKANLFVCSSFFEGFSTVVSEAVILGIPVVTTDCTGAQEILGDSEYGIVTAKDNESLYEGLKLILTNREVYQYYADAVKRRQPFFDQQRQLAAIEELFD